MSVETETMQIGKTSHLMNTTYIGPHLEISESLHITVLAVSF